MKSEEVENIVFLTVIARREQKDPLLSALLESGARLVNTMYGRGTAMASYLQSAFGLVPERNEVVITCMLAREKSDAIFKMLVEKFKFEKPNTGIAFTISIERISF